MATAQLYVICLHQSLASSWLISAEVEEGTSITFVLGEATFEFNFQHVDGDNAYEAPPGSDRNEAVRAECFVQLVPCKHKSNAG